MLIIRSSQYWSEVVTIIPHEENNIELNLDLLALDLTNDPNPATFHGVPPELEPEKVLLASIGSLTGLLGQSVILEIPEEAVYYYVNDHLGTPQKIMDQSGTVVWNADYKPFGGADVDPVSTLTNSFRFPGQYYDEETGLHYNWHRYYDPKTGRYLRADPYKGNINEPGTLLPYPYCLSNPIVNVDVEGLLCKPRCLPFWKSSSVEKTLGRQKETWLSGADVLCYYMTRQRDLIKKLTETKFICMYFKSDECGKCKFDTIRIKTGKDWHEEWTGWRVIERFTARPVSRYMGHTGPVTVCPPRGPNYRGAIPSIIP